MLAAVTPNMSGSFEQEGRPDAATAPAAPELVSEHPRFAIGTEVSFLSRSSQDILHGLVAGYNRDGTYRLHQWRSPADMTAMERVLQGRADPLRINVLPEYPGHLHGSVEPRNTPIAKAPQPIGVPQTSIQRAPPVKALPPGLHRHTDASGAARVSRVNPNEPAALEVPPAAIALSLRSAVSARSESVARPPQGLVPIVQPPPAQLVLPGAAACRRQQRRPGRRTPVRLTGGRP
ncbi:hypothetical protein N9L68_00695 [bacterium]|nr:hypothetical protein [bacterium]